MTWVRCIGLLAAPLALGCGTGGGANYSLDVGTEEAGPSFVLRATDSGQGGLDAYIEQN